MKAKILVYALPALILAAIHLAEAQQRRKSHGSGYLIKCGSAWNSPTNHFDKDFVTLATWRARILPLNFGRRRIARLTELATELVRLKVDLIVAQQVERP